MTATPNPRAMAHLPVPGQKVHWHNPEQAKAWGWVGVFGNGPFDVVRVVDKSNQGLPSSMILRTALGEYEINEIWLALDKEPGNGSKGVEQKHAR